MKEEDSTIHLNTLLTLEERKKLAEEVIGRSWDSYHWSGEDVQKYRKSLGLNCELFGMLLLCKPGTVIMMEKRTRSYISKSCAIELDRLKKRTDMIEQKILLALCDRYAWHGIDEIRKSVKDALTGCVLHRMVVLKKITTLGFSFYRWDRHLWKKRLEIKEEALSVLSAEDHRKGFKIMCPRCGKYLTSSEIDSGICSFCSE